MILKCVCGIYVDGLDVVFRYEIIFLLKCCVGRVIIEFLFSAFVIMASFFLSFVFIEFSIFIFERVLCMEWSLSHVCSVSICSATSFL